MIAKENAKVTVPSASSTNKLISLQAHNSNIKLIAGYGGISIGTSSKILLKSTEGSSERTRR